MPNEELAPEPEQNPGFQCIRLEAHMRFTPQSGMGQWAVDQLQQRLTMAFHIKEDQINTENTVCYADSDGTFILRSFWPIDRQDLVDDTQNTLLALAPWLKDGGEESWMRAHICNHALTDTQPCPDHYWQWPEEEVNDAGY